MNTGASTFGALWLSGREEEEGRGLGFQGKGQRLHLIRWQSSTFSKIQENILLYCSDFKGRAKDCT
jgi:hypothetical protein